MEQARERALRFDASEGRWREVSTSMKDATQAMWSYWRRALETAHKQCDDLARGDGHPEVVRALAELGKARSESETELVRLEAEHRRWTEGIAELRAWYKADTRAVRDMFCSLPESPWDTDEGAAYLVKLVQIVDRMRDRLRPRYDDISEAGKSLTARLQVLEKRQDERVKKEAARLRGKIEGTLRSLSNLMVSELRGANHPEFRTFMEVGRNEHRRIQSDSSKCVVSEVTIPDSRLRIDCVRVSSGTCYLVEIKPDNSAARDRGNDQLQKYLAAMKRHFKRNSDDVKKGFTGKLEVFQRCITNGEISLKSELRVYQLCPPEGKLFHDFVVE
jgi:hypothetical protein